MIEQKEQNNVEYFSYMCNIITNDARRTREIKSRFVIVKKYSFHQQIRFKCKEENSKVLHLERSLVRC